MEAHPEAVLSFCDHHIINEKGEIEAAATDKNTAYFGRNRLAPGIHQPFKKLALLDLSIPMAMAVLLRRESIAWDHFPDLVCAYDFWLVYLACRDGGACYYLPERLTSYRVHSASESTLGRVRLNMGFIEIYSAMLEDQRVGEFHPLFRRRMAVHYTETAIALLRQGDREKARSMTASSLQLQSSLKARLTYLASFVPGLLSRHLPGKLRFPITSFITSIPSLCISNL